MQNLKLRKLLNKELQRQQDYIELIASENYASSDVLEAAGSILTNKYAEGFPGKRYYGGCKYVDEIEQLAIDSLKKLFNAQYANVQPHSGSTANAIVYLALLNPGDKVLAMDLNAGGHLTHGSKVNFSGKTYEFHSYGLNPETELLDYAAIEKQALQIKPKLIVCGASNYSRFIDFSKFQKIAKKCGAYLMADIAHIAGLIATKLHPDALPYCDVVTSTTHKTLRGPRSGIIMSNNPDLFKKLNSATFPGSQGGPLEHIIAAKYVAFEEALKPSFVTYQKQVLANAKALAKVFQENGFHVTSNGTDNHLLSVNVFKKVQVTGDLVEKWLYDAGIVVNKNTVPNEPNSPQKPSGIRLGSPAMTTRKFKCKEFVQVGQWIVDIINSKGDLKTIKDIKSKVRVLLKRFPIYTGLKY
uniref:serine hydroxymethyltransferase n=1 Tax=[Mycoplasma] testudinis TaxID=33924 RepID=UPI0004827009